MPSTSAKPQWGAQVVCQFLLTEFPSGIPVSSGVAGDRGPQLASPVVPHWWLKVLPEPVEPPHCSPADVLLGFEYPLLSGPVKVAVSNDSAQGHSALDWSLSDWHLFSIVA